MCVNFIWNTDELNPKQTDFPSADTTAIQKNEAFHINDKKPKRSVKALV